MHTTDHVFTLENADYLAGEELTARVAPLQLQHLDSVVARWKYSEVLGEEAVARSLSFGVEKELLYGSFVNGQLVAWSGMNRYDSFTTRCVYSRAQVSGSLNKMDQMVKGIKLLGASIYDFSWGYFFFTFHE